MSNSNQNKYSLTIGWLYPELMSTYGDRGNILVLQKRCEWRGIDVDILPIDQMANSKQLEAIDLLFGGGAQDREQDIVMHDLSGKKAEKLKELVERDIPALFVCGSPQLMGKYYEPAEGTRIEGVGLFDMVSRHPGKNAKRLIGNTVAEVYWENLTSHPGEATTSIGSHINKDFTASNPRKDDSPTTNNQRLNTIVVGFENHGGRTYLGKNAKPFAKVIKGYGNNGEDGQEGVIYKNAIGCYFHGPLLPKNPEIADWLIQKALEVKYHNNIELSKLDDYLEHRAKKAIVQKLGVTV